MLHAKKVYYDINLEGANVSRQYAIDADRNGQKDSNGNGCDWYDINYMNTDYETNSDGITCGSYNTPEFEANKIC